MKSEIEALTKKIEAARPKLTAVQEQVARVIVGQKHLIDRLMIGLLANGHVLLEGVPGIAKTATCAALAQSINMKFQRIQFTPDLLPSDLVGNLIYNPRDGVYSTRKGPVFANLVLADEINRAPAKVQSALLEVDAGAPGDHRRPDLQAAGAFPGAGDPEPHRARGHLPAARGPGRRVHAQGPGLLPQRGGGKRRSSI